MHRLCVFAGNLKMQKIKKNEKKWFFLIYFIFIAAGSRSSNSSRVTRFGRIFADCVIVYFE
jgi:hypothetical protein